MLKRINVSLLLVILIIVGCNDEWDKYYNQDPGETLNHSVWEVISGDPEYSIFVNYLKDNGVDSLLKTNRSITVFVPKNEAFNGFNNDSVDMRLLLKYHIMERVMNMYDITGSRKIENSSGKYALVERVMNRFTVDGSEITYFSPLCKDGRFYVIEDVLYPRPTLYAFIAENSSIYKRYIDQFREVLLDVNKSVPIGFDESGNTIYDSVFSVINLFDDYFFPVNTEFRNRTATMVVFDEDQYNGALDEMASKLGGIYKTYEDIPLDWQLKVLLPKVVRDGIFENSLRYEEFKMGRMKNIAGDSVNVDFMNINESSRFICSNGVAFKYLGYSVPEELFLKERRIQGEHLVRLLGASTYGWAEGISVSGSSSPPTISFSSIADNDSIVSMQLGINYSGQFELEFKFTEVFPMRYRLVWATNNIPSGLYSVSVNGVPVTGPFGNNLIDLFSLRLAYPSVTGALLIPTAGSTYSKCDFWVDNITEYDDVTVKIKYMGRGARPGNSMRGFTIDYMALIPAN